jgi:hypothetical protein
MFPQPILDAIATGETFNLAQLNALLAPAHQEWEYQPEDEEEEEETEEEILATQQFLSQLQFQPLKVTEHQESTCLQIEVVGFDIASSLLACQPTQTLKS